MAGLFLLGAALAASYLLSYMFLVEDPRFGLQRSRRPYVRVDDETIILVFVLAGGMYLVALIWIWMRNRHNRAIGLAVALTVGIWAVAIPVLLALEMTFGGDQEILLFGVFFLALAVTLLAWVQLWRWL